MAHDAIEAILADLSGAGRYTGASANFDPFIVVLFAEAARTLKRPALLRVAVDMLNTAISALPNERAIGLFTGVSRLGWLASWLRDSLVTSRNEARDDDPCVRLDSFLERATGRWDQLKQPYDLISGITGIGVYALRRGRRGSEKLLEPIVNYFQRTAEETPDGLTWRTPSPFLPAGHRTHAPVYNLGVAHGVAGVIGLLGHVYRSGIAADTVARLIDGAVTWILRQQLPAGDGARCPHWTGEGIPPQPGRMAWCYGGLGLSAALMIAGRAVRRDAWEEAAVRFALLESTREFDHTGVQDAGLCHGAAGIAFIFQRFFNATIDARFHRASQTWCRRVLQMRAGKGVGGYQFFDRGVFADDASFLCGSAGVGLVLLTAVSEEPPTWDGVLLTDIPSRLESARSA